MKTLTVDLPGRSYPLHIGRGLLDRAGETVRAALPKAGKLAVITDSVVGPLYAQRTLSSLERAGFATRLITVPAGETSKSVETLSGLYNSLAAFGLTRSDAVVALGGGVVGDLAGFAAATFLRGVALVQIPTTLLAQVDSSVGGKTAVDLPAGKNLVGAFWQPSLVLMDPSLLLTLTDADFSCGMAEVIKYGCIADAGFFSTLEQRPSRQELMGEIESILYTCCDIKRNVVVEDERDTGRRMLLNFGHTLGHAYERAGGYRRWTHGQAVSAGMVKAAELGTALGITPQGTAERIAVLLSCFGLPILIPCSQEDYTAAIGLDKKGSGEELSLILLEELGAARIHQMPKGELLAMLKEDL